MSEVHSRTPLGASRGRGSSRGGRGGSSVGGRGALTNRGARGSANGTSDSIGEDQGEVGQLLKQYAAELAQLKEMFPDWTSEDIVFALDENQGDVQITVEKISEGFTSQWGEVKKKNKDRARSKAKEPATRDSLSDNRGIRGGRAPFDGSRGGRGGRGGLVDRGGRVARGRGGASNGAPRPVVKPRAEELTPATGATGAWGETVDPTPAGDAWGAGAKADTEGAKESAWGSNDTPAEKPAVKAPAPAPAPAVPAPKTTTWASLLHKPTPPPKPVQQKPVAPPAPQPIPEKAPTPPKEPEPIVEETVEPEIPSPAVSEEPATAEPVEAAETEPVETAEVEEISQQEPLTEVNLEKIEDAAPPAPTGTAASTIATTTERQESTSTATSSAVPQPPAPAPTTPAKQPVTKGTPGRSSFRRVLHQQEGVIMPGNHGEVARAALQFGSMGLNGDIDDEEEPEQPEPVVQPQQPSPIAQPIATLPPTGPAQQIPVAETIPTPRQAPGMPTQPQAIPQQANTQQPPLAPHSMTQQPVNSFGAQYGRYGAPEQPQAKSYESYGHMQQHHHHQQQQHHQTAPPPTQPQQTQAQQAQASQAAYASYMQPQQQPSHIGIGVSSAPEQHYGSYYADRSQPPGFGLYGNSSYMQSQQVQNQQEAGQSQQRASSGLSGATDPAQIPSSVSGAGQVQQPTSRYGAPTAAEQVSGQATPSPALPASQAQQQSMGQQYPVQFHPYYNQYMHQQSYYSQPSPFGGKNMYGYPQQQYMSPGYSDQSSSPAAIGGFGAPATQSRDAMGASLGDYNRMNTSAAQQSLPQQPTAGGYGNGIPNFLNPRGLPQDQQQLSGASVGQQPGVPQSQAEDLKFGENKPPTGPSATPLQGQPGRPGSATSGASALGPQQGGQAPGMYSSHLNPAHGHQGQQSAYGQNQSAYSMYSGGYPSQYPQGSGRHGAGGASWGYGH